MRKVSETDILRPWKARLDAKRRTELAQPRAVHLRRFAKGVLAIIETDEASRWTSFSVRPIFNEVLSIKGFLFWRKWGKLVTLFYSLAQ